MKTDHQVAEEIFSQCFRIADPYLLGTVASLVSGPSLVCSALLHEKEGITVGELAKYASVAPSRITAILDDFESKGFVKRFPKKATACISTRNSPNLGWKKRRITRKA